MLAFGSSDPGDYVCNMIDTFVKSGSETHELYEDSKAIEANFPDMRVPEGFIACADPEAGLLKADQILVASRVGISFSSKDFRPPINFQFAQTRNICPISP